MANITIPELDPLENVPDDAIIYVVVDGQDYRTTKGELLQSITSQISSALSGYATELYADAKVADTITDGITTVAPSQNAVFDALNNKQDTLTAVNAGAFESSLTGKATIEDTDLVSIVDNTDGKLKKTSWLNVWTNYIKAFVQAMVSNQKTVTTNVTLDETYNNAIVKVKSTATITIPTGLSNNFNCVFDVWSGATATFNITAITLNASVGTTLTAGKMATLYQDAQTNVYRLRGELS